MIPEDRLKAAVVKAALGRHLADRRDRQAARQAVGRRARDVPARRRGRAGALAAPGRLTDSVGARPLALPHRAVDVRTSAPVTRLLLIVLALTAVATLIGVGVLWPSGERPPTPYSADGVTYPDGEVLRVGEACPVVTEESTEFPEVCDDVDVRLDGDAGTVTELRVRPGVVDAVQVGDRVTLVADPAGGQRRAQLRLGGCRPGAGALGWYALVFVVVVALVARIRGLLAIVGLVLGGLVIVRFMLPALLTGKSGVAVALVPPAPSCTSSCIWRTGCRSVRARHWPGRWEGS